MLQILSSIHDIYFWARKGGSSLPAIVGISHRSDNKLNYRKLHIVGTVPTFQMHNVRTVPTFQIYNVGTVLTYKTHNVGTVPTFKMQNVGTVSIYRDRAELCHTQIRIRLNWIKLKIEDVHENEDHRKNENSLQGVQKKMSRSVCLISPVTSILED